MQGRASKPPHGTAQRLVGTSGRARSVSLYRPPVDDSPFDLAALFDQVDRRRVQIGASWSAVARATGVAATTIRRFATAGDAEADGVLTVVSWLGVPPESFIVGAGPGEALPPRHDGFVRVDMARVAAVTGQRRAGSRTSIQRLAEVAHSSYCTIASLVRVSEAIDP